MDNYFSALNAVDVREHQEKKNGLTYLSWAWAWAEVKKRHPDATYRIYESESGCFYHTDGRTCWVKASVTVNGIEHIEYLPVMDNRNKSIALNAVTSFDVNKSVQRCITKACARHGLGLYIYAGEDLPESDNNQPEPDEPTPPPLNMNFETATTDDFIAFILAYAEPDAARRSQEAFGEQLERINYSVARTLAMKIRRAKDAATV